MATSIFPANTGDIIQAQHVDLLATSQAWLGIHQVSFALPKMRSNKARPSLKF